MVPNMTEPLVSLPAFVSQLNMNLMLDSEGLHELVLQQNGLYTVSKLLATYQDSTWSSMSGYAQHPGPDMGWSALAKGAVAAALIMIVGQFALMSFETRKRCMGQASSPPGWSTQRGYEVS